MVGFDPVLDTKDSEWRSILKRELGAPSTLRLLHVADAFRVGFSLEDIFNLSKIDPWFLAEIEDLVLEEAQLSGQVCADLNERLWRRAKRKGFSDARLAQLLGCLRLKFARRAKQSTSNPCIGV